MEPEEQQIKQDKIQQEAKVSPAVIREELHLPRILQQFVKDGQLDKSVLEVEISRFSVALSKKEVEGKNLEGSIKELALGFQKLTEDNILNLAYNLGNKLIYQNYLNQKQTLAEITQDFVIHDRDTLCIYLLYRISHAPNPKEIILFLNSLFNQIKVTQKKFLFIETYFVLIPRLTNRHQTLGTIFPIIIKALNETARQFTQQREKYENLDDAKVETRFFLENFEKWTLDLMNRCNQVICSLPQQQTPIFDIFEGWAERSNQKMNAIYDQETFKVDSEKQALQLQQSYILMFMMDLHQGLLEASGQSKFFDIKTLEQFIESHENSILSIVPSFQSFIQICHKQLMLYSHSTQLQFPDVVNEYSPELRFNIASSVTFLLRAIFNNDWFNLYSREQQLKIALPFLNQYMSFDRAHDTTQIEFLIDISSIVTDLTQEKQPLLLGSSIFRVKQSEILNQILELSGTNIKGAEQKKILQLVDDFINLYHSDSQWTILSQILLTSSNIDLASFLLNGKLRKEISAAVSDHTKISRFCNFNQIRTFLQSFWAQKLNIDIINDRMGLFINYIVLVELLLRFFVNQSKNEIDSEHYLSRQNAPQIIQFAQHQNGNYKKNMEKLQENINKERAMNKDKKLTQEENKINLSKDQSIDNISFHINSIDQLIADLEQIKE